MLDLLVSCLADSLQLNRYFTYNVGSKQFEPLEYALSLERESGNHTFGTGSILRPVAGAVNGDVEMTGSV